MGNLVGKEDDVKGQSRLQGRESSALHSDQDLYHQEATSAEMPDKIRLGGSNNYDKDPDSSQVDASYSTTQEPYGEGIVEELDNNDSIPMVFRWDGGGKNVYITGTFNKWSEKIPMRRSGADFLYIRELKKGKHAYKFIVDDEWRFAPDQPTVADPHGYINNFVDLTNFDCIFDAETKPLSNKDKITDDSLYVSFCPDPEDPQWYAKEPPPLPPHLRQIILNTAQSNDSLAAKSMQVPQHVTLNHLYCAAIKENLMVLGVTQRYREKFVTTVFYSPLPDANHIGRAAAAVSGSMSKKNNSKLNAGSAPPLPPSSR
mmetsp:Transcript_10/g.34  ORF Transcript_10/g.34 Transcript_10/m.34 type:complete len:315 (-) Transcript_10:3606-4550(-)